MKNIKSCGFSLLETMITLGLLSAIGVGAMYITKNQTQTKTTLTAKNDVEQTVMGYEVTLSEPSACGSILKGVTPGTTLSELKDASGKAFLKVGDTSDGGFHKLSNIAVGNLDSVSRTIKISFSFDGEKQGAVPVTKFVTITPIMNVGVIDGCINPFDLASDAVLKKMCMDVDPRKEGDCLKNLEHLMVEIKELYCKDHPLLEYDSANKTCKSLDANKTCGGNFLQGYDGSGKLICYPHDTTPDVPPRSVTTIPTGCPSWSNPVPSLDSICLGTPVAQTQTCTDGSGQTRTVSGFGTKTDGVCTSCSDNSWAPATDQHCLGASFTQKSNCNNSRAAIGTKLDGSCAKGCPAVPDKSWTKVGCQTGEACLLHRVCQGLPPGPVRGAGYLCLPTSNSYPYPCTGSMTTEYVPMSSSSCSNISKSCSAPLPASNEGATVSISDTSAPAMGTANFKCVSGAWVEQAGSTCGETAPVPPKVGKSCTVRMPFSWADSSNPTILCSTKDAGKMGPTATLEDGESQSFSGVHEGYAFSVDDGTGQGSVQMSCEDGVLKMSGGSCSCEMRATHTH